MPEYKPPLEPAMTENVTISERAARRIGQILKSEGDGTFS